MKLFQKATATKKESDLNSKPVPQDQGSLLDRF